MTKIQKTQRTQKIQRSSKNRSSESSESSESFEHLLAAYDYALPPEAIAKQPASPRDSARLLIYDRARDRVTFDVFSNIGAYLPPRAVLVLNETKVLPARMQLTKATGGKIEALYLHDEGAAAIRVLATGTLRGGETLTWEDGRAFTVEAREGREAVLAPLFDRSQLRDALEQYGRMPLPPYMADSPLSEQERRTEYQTVFARSAGSAAAPTAGLHFTPELLASLEAQGVTIARVMLHVGLGTFAPLEETHVRTKKLHKEQYSIDPQTAAMLLQAKQEDRPIIAVGTTSVRTLESAFRTNPPVLTGETDLFLTEEDRPQFTNALITNFHVPRSSLLMLVAAFMGREKLLELYDRALENKMRFLSFGDAMLVL